MKKSQQKNKIWIIIFLLQIIKFTLYPKIKIIIYFPFMKIIIKILIEMTCFTNLLNILMIFQERLIKYLIMIFLS